LVRARHKPWEAMTLAMEVHKDQTCRWTGLPYASHLAEVAGLVAAVDFPSMREAMIMTAWLHDSVEDHPEKISLAQIRDQFSFHTEEGVMLLTRKEKWKGLPKKEREDLYNKQLASAPGWVQTIKVADIISNCSSVMDHDPEYGPRYIWSKVDTMNHLAKANPMIRMTATKLLGRIIQEHRL
jgi:GTP diphosphokinase / guanosine-3',5'-bis(diphosphate) 3'-diphosphatase